MKDKKYLILIMIIIGLVLTNVGTVAYYMRTINGTIKGNTGAFTFDVLHNGNTITTINLYETMENPSLTEEYIIPGDSGKFDLLVTAEGSVPGVEYSIDLAGTNIPTNMKFYLDEAKTKALKLEYGILGYFKPEDQTKQKIYTIYWDWPYDSGSSNKYDIDYQNKEITIDVTIIGKQSDGYAMMKNGFSKFGEGNTVGMWNKEYSLKVLSINFSTDLSNMPSECTDANLCWDISDESSRYPVYHYLTANAEDSSMYDAYIVSEKEIYAPVDSSYLLSLATRTRVETDGNHQYSYITSANVKNINFNDAFNTSKVKSMLGLFFQCEYTSLDLSSFNTSKVTSMMQMFDGCSSLTSLDLSSFNTSNVTSMRIMFRDCSSLTSLDLSSFNTSNVTNMSYMFENCSFLITTINITSSNITSYGNMFDGAATNTGSQITVNYIADASTLVDNMIATKSSTSNVVKGSQI